ncbi:MAG: glutathione synthase [Devosiaceae bacterium]|nr:glutathione synthase [Devosiaceae bacterium MH13]
MSLSVAVQMDPIERISIAGDSTFAMMLEAQARGHQLSVYTPDSMAQQGGTVTASVQNAQVRDVVGDHVTLGPAERRDLTEYDVILLRQDPPFDMAYITSTHMLEQVQRTSAGSTLVVNDPAAVRNAPEKILVMRFADLMPPTLITQDESAIEAFWAKHKDIVLKPLYGHGGKGVVRLRPGDQNLGSLIGLFRDLFPEPWVAQSFMPEVAQGDKRILLVEGEPFGLINRVPAEGDLRSNMVVGGRAEASALTDRDREICAAIGPTLRELGLLFVGIDVIGPFITEINVTSPTGIRALEKLGGGNAAAAMWDAIEAKRVRTAA